MYKKLIAAYVGIAGSMSYVSADAPIKISTVNIVDLLRESEEGKKVSAELEAMHKQLTQEFQVAKDDYVKSFSAFQERSKALSPEAREKEQTQFMDKQQDLEARAQKAENTLRLKMQTASDHLTRKAQKAIENYAQQNKVDAVFDTASGRAVWSSGKTDITKSMVNVLNNEYKLELAQAANPKKEAAVLAKADGTKAPVAVVTKIDDKKAAAAA